MNISNVYRNHLAAFLTVLLPFTPAIAQNPKVHLEIDPGRMMVIRAPLPAGKASVLSSNFEILDVKVPPSPAGATRHMDGEGGVKPSIVFTTPVYVDKVGFARFPTPYILMRFEPWVPKADQMAYLAAFHDLEILEEDFAHMANCYRLQSAARTGQEVLATVDLLLQVEGVRWAEPDWISEGRPDAVTPNDPLFPELWGIRNTGQEVEDPDNPGSTVEGVPDRDVNADDVWSFTTGYESVIVVVLDDGVEQDHPDINQIPGMDFTDSPYSIDGGPSYSCDKHGTVMAGIISAVSNNATGLTGVAPGVRIASAKIARPAERTCSSGLTYYGESAVTQGLDWAQSIGARITLNSNEWGFNNAVSDKYAQTRNAGIVHFASAGNINSDHPDGAVKFPASEPSVLAIGAVMNNGARWPYSNYGSELFATAPGYGIWSTDRTGLLNGYDWYEDYVSVNGTSPAAAYAAGVAALLLSVDGALRPNEVEATLAQTARFYSFGPYFGHGILDTRGAVEAVGDVFVDHTQPPSGNGSLAAPLKTLFEGLAATAPGETIIIKSESYPGSMTINQHVTIKASHGPLVLGGP